jgi:hypothetical protein
VVKSLTTLRFGVNYVPSRGWYYSWNDFHPEDFARDFDAIAGLGADHVRIQTIWPWFHPNPSWVSPAHLDRLRQVVGLAGERGLDSWVCAFTGWLSGYSFTPPFQPQDSFYSPASDPHQRLYLAALGGALQDLPSFAGFDLGNELNCAWKAPDLDQGDAWMTRRLEDCRLAAPNGTHVNGVDHQPWFYEDTFSPKALAAASPITALHCWTFFTGALEKGGPLDPAAVGLLARMAALARSHSGDSSKPIWVQEFGGSREWMPEETLLRHMEAVTLKGIEGGVSWFTWWCSHDIARSYRFDDLEYPLGLLDVNNRIKPEGEVFKVLAEAWRGQERRLPVAPPAPPAHNRESVWNWLMALDV